MAKQTSVMLTGTIKDVKERLAPIYGLKNIISAGLLMFADLNETERAVAIARVHKIEGYEEEIRRILDAIETGIQEQDGNQGQNNEDD